MALVEFPKAHNVEKYSDHFFRKCFFEYYYNRNVDQGDRYLQQQLRVALFHCKDTYEVFYVLFCLSQALNTFQSDKVISLSLQESNRLKRNFAFLNLSDQQKKTGKELPLIFPEVIKEFLSDHKEMFYHRDLVSLYSGVDITYAIQKHLNGEETMRMRIKIHLLGEFWF